MDTIEQWSREYGDEGVFELDIIGERVVVVCRWEEMLPILALRPFKMTRFSRIDRIGLAHRLQGVFYAEGKQWSTQRRLIAPAFSKPAIDSYLPAMCEIVEQLVAKVTEHSRGGRTVNVSLLMRDLNADVISKVAFGREFGALRKGAQEVRDIEDLMQAMVKRFLCPVAYWRIPGLSRLLGDRAHPAIDHLFASFERLLSASPPNLRASTVLGKLAEAEGGLLTHQELLGNLVVLFIAGTDTTTITLAWALYHLSLQPDVQEAVAQEAQAFATGLETARHLEELLWARAVWHETLRIHFVGPMVDVDNQEPYELAGRVIPPHTPIWLLWREAFRRSPQAQQALGTDWDAFRPARWLAPEGGLVECPPLDSLPFGHGARYCLGKSLANTTGPLVLSELLRRFRLGEWRGEPLRERSAHVQCPNRDVEISFVLRT